MLLKGMSKIASTYTGKSGEKYHTEVNLVNQSAFDLVAKSREVKLRPYIKKTDIVLEFGVGTGWNIARLNACRHVGYDIAEHLKPALEQLNIEFTNDVTSLADSSFDVVLCHHVLEHVAEPACTLMEILRLLKPAGRLLLFLPYESGSRFNVFNKFDQNHHLYSWTCQSAGNLVTACGFKVAICRKQNFGFDRLASTIVTSFCNSYHLFKILRRLLRLIRQDHEIFILGNADK